MFWILILALLLIVKVCSIVNFSQHHINVQVTDQVHGNWHQCHPMTIWFISSGTNKRVTNNAEITKNNCHNLSHSTQFSEKHMHSERELIT
jgi:hypothetical protein